MNINNLVSSFRGKTKNSVKFSNYTHHTPEVKAEAVRLRLTGLKIIEVAEQLGICKGAVQRFCANKLSEKKLSELAELSIDKTRGIRNEGKIKRHDKIREMIASGEKLSNRAMSKILGVTSTTINNDMKAINNVTS